jgi:hypothetical protein
MQQGACTEAQGHLLDDFFGADENGRRDVKAENASGFEVDDQLELGGELDRQIRGLRSLEDAVDVAGGPAE